MFKFNIYLYKCYIYCHIVLADGHRWRRQADDSKKDESLEQELCKDKDAGEWFRLVAGEGDNCRDVIQCTASVSVIGEYYFSIHIYNFLFYVTNQCHMSKLPIFTC